MLKSFWVNKEYRPFSQCHYLTIYLHHHYAFMIQYNKVKGLYTLEKQEHVKHQLGIKLKPKRTSFSVQLKAQYRGEQALKLCHLKHLQIGKKNQGSFALWTNNHILQQECAFLFNGVAFAYFQSRLTVLRSIKTR